MTHTEWNVRYAAFNAAVDALLMRYAHLRQIALRKAEANWRYDFTGCMERLSKRADRECDRIPTP